jgi:pimeloyl-ACP methyl ester carboxylesterase
MPIVSVNGVRINCDEYGSGEPVVLITGTGGRGRGWTAHQVPALTAAGYRVITVDNRGVPPSDTGPAGFTIDDMVADTAGLIENLGAGPCRIVGFSLGGIIVQETLLARPDLVSQAVLMATRGRSDAMRSALSAAWSELDDSGVVLPPRYAAVMRAMQYLSPATLDSERQIRDWLDIFEMSPPESAIEQAQRGLDEIEDRLEEYRKIAADCLVISFADDLVVPPFFGSELAEYIPACRYAEVSGCGHYGHLEKPDEVNSLIVDFFRGSGPRPAD